jgi:hypothetical protein
MNDFKKLSDDAIKFIIHDAVYSMLLFVGFTDVSDSIATIADIVAQKLNKLASDLKILIDRKLAGISLSFTVIGINN